VVAKVMESLAQNKQRSQRCYPEKFNFKKLSVAEGKEKYRVKVSNRFAALKDLDSELGSNSAWETIRENMNISAESSLGYYVFKKHKPWFDKECSKLLDEMKQAKLQLLQDSSEMNVEKLNNVRHESSKYFRTERREYLKDRINEHATNNKNKNIRELYRGINEFTKGFQPRNNCMKEENGDILPDSHAVLNMWKNYFPWLLSVYNVSDDRQIEIHTA
jgi:hypothetical protein